MERGVIACPKWRRALWFLLFNMLLLSHAAQAEITCGSCQLGNKWGARELLLNFNFREPATELKGEVFGYGDGPGRSGAAGAESRRLRCAGCSAECGPERAGCTEPRLKRNTDSRLHAKGEFSESEFAKVKVSHVKPNGQRKTRDEAAFTSATWYTKRAKRSSNDDEFRPAGSAQSQDPGTGKIPAAGRRVMRSQLRWSGDERRAAGPRQEELKLNSSTFALTGDSSHNQAMVHWSGQNSSVSDLLYAL